MPECQQNHGRIPMPVTVITGRLHHAFNLALGQVLAGPIMGVGETTARDCSLFSAWYGAGWYRIHWDKSGVLSEFAAAGGLMGYGPAARRYRHHRQSASSQTRWSS